MSETLKRIIIVIVVVLLAVIVVFAYNKNLNKKSTKKEDTKTEQKQEQEEQKQNLDDGDIEFPEEFAKKIVQCTYEGKEKNVVWEKSYVNFNLDANNRVITREDVREYKFEKINIDDYINNKTLNTISKVLDGIKGVSSTLTTINAKEHTYRFSTTFDFTVLKQDDLYNIYYKRFYTGDIEMTRDEFDERYKSLDYDAMVKAYLDKGYICK